MDSDKNNPSPKERFLNVLLAAPDSPVGAQEDNRAVLAAKQRVDLAVKVLRGHDGIAAIRTELEKVEKAAAEAVGKERTQALVALEKAHEACANLRRAAETHVSDKLLPALVRAIVNAGPNVPRYAETKSIVATWKQTGSPSQDPMPAFEFMAVCKSFSTNAEVQKLLRLGRNRLVERVAEGVGSECGRQVASEWQSHTADVADRGQAWDLFLQGLVALAQNPKGRAQYLSNCFAHGKGYSQIHTSAQSYLLIETAQAETDFPTVVRLMLAATTNVNIWGAGMKGSGKIADQLALGPDLEAAKPGPDDPKKKPKRSLKVQEEHMWSIVVTQLFDCHNPSEKDWSYVKTIQKEQGALFQAVQAACQYKLSERLLKDALDMFPA